MVVDPKQELHHLVDGLSDAYASRLARAIRHAGLTGLTRQPRPLTDADIVIATPMMPEEEAADDLFAESRRLRFESAYG